MTPATSAQRSNFTGASALQPRHASPAASGMTIAERIFKMTGKVHLASRSGQRWHLCGLNE